MASRLKAGSGVGPGIATLFLAIALSTGLRAEPVPDRIMVQLDKARLVKVPAHADTVVVGNPSIADVTMMKRNGLMVVTGKGFGETNVIFIDGSGQSLSEATVTVTAGQGLLTVQRGMDRESYSCTPRCQPAVSLGDATKYLSDASTQITSRNTLVTPQH